MTTKDLGLLTLLGAMFGSAFLFMRVAAPAFGPAFLIDLRVFLAAGVLLLWAHFIRETIQLRRPWQHWLWLGALNAAVPFTLVAWAELHISSSLAAILMGTLPLFTALVAAVWLKEALTRKKGLGLLLGLAGVGVISGWSPFDLTGSTLLAIAAVLLASLSYALGSVYVKTHFGGVPRVTLTVGNLAAAGLLLLPLAALTPPAALPATPAVLALLGLVVIGTVFPFLLYFKLLERVGATAATSVAFLIPVFGTLWGAIFLAEALNASMLLGFGVTLLGVTLVNDVRLQLRLRASLGRRYLRKRWQANA